MFESGDLILGILDPRMMLSVPQYQPYQQTISDLVKSGFGNSDLRNTLMRGHDKVFGKRKTCLNRIRQTRRVARHHPPLITNPKPRFRAVVLLPRRPNQFELLNQHSSLLVVAPWAVPLSNTSIQLHLSRNLN